MLLNWNAGERPVVSERPGGALKPLQVAWSSWDEQFSGGTRAPLQYCAMTGEFPGVKLLLTATRSEEHTSELQSQSNLVCRLLLEKKKTATAGTLTWASFTSPSLTMPVKLVKSLHS